MAVSEKIELLGKGLYTDIPDVLTLTSIPTASELEYVGSEDFEKTMLESILPKSVEEKVDFKQLLEIDFQWVCRCLRILNYGPYFSVNAVYCTECKKMHQGDYKINFESIECKPLPPGFVNDIVIKKEEFLDFKGDVHIKLPTIQQMMNAEKDKVFQNSNGEVNVELARMCYMISSIGNNSNLTPVEIKMMIQRDFSPADYIILKTRVSEMSDYGLRSGGLAVCPKCHKPTAMFMALTMDKFFRPSVGDLREWKNSKSAGAGKDVSRDASKTV